jgi:hypothetical protein
MHIFSTSQVVRRLKLKALHSFCNSHVLNLITNHTLTQTGANKAGMESIDKDKQAQIIYEMSKGSLFFKRQLEQDEKVNQKVSIMKQKLLSMTVTQKQSYMKISADKRMKIEKLRSFERICCVLDMDMFFAAVEIRDQPHLKDLPVAVGGEFTGILKYRIICMKY